MNDLISRQAAIEVIGAVFPVDPMKSEYAQGIACGAALAKTYVEQLPSAKPEIIRCKDCRHLLLTGGKARRMTLFEALQPDSPYVFYSDDHGFCINTADVMDFLTMDKESVIYRQAAIDAVEYWHGVDASEALEKLPSVEPEKEKAKRVLWTGWKGCRDTRYKCPNCQKPVRNDDVYCHRCGQKLMFPHISFTDYIPGEEQELIVRWDDE